ncbi:MAG: trypsin-like peptidase domain-containing protein [Candidatus Omnitrophica bacterium]|nr:trypsin-like peptidase domain-containing protein [Candidatus Omnitrophota bacterium]
MTKEEILSKIDDREDKPYNEFIKKPSNSNMLINVSLVIGVIILLASQMFLFKMMTQERARTSAAAVTAQVDVSSQGSDTSIMLTSDITLVSCSDDDLSDAVAYVRPSIVNIDVMSEDVPSDTTQRRGAPLSFDMPPVESLESNAETLGSGIIVDGKGYILTCYHMIKNIPAIYVTVFTSARKTTYKAKLIRVDIDNNLALIKIDASYTLPAVRLGNSDLIKITDPVLTIGSPFGLEHTVTRGIISDNERSLVIEGKVYPGLLQFDAAMNRGSAGGAVIDSEGNVLGIATAIVSTSGYFAGISFAVPINRARPLLLSGIEV